MSSETTLACKALFALITLKWFGVCAEMLLKITLTCETPSALEALMYFPFCMDATVSSKMTRISESLLAFFAKIRLLSGVYIILCVCVCVCVWR